MSNGAGTALWRSAQAITGEACRQRVLGAGYGAHETVVAPPLTHVHLHMTGRVRALESVKRVTRAISKLIWLFVIGLPIKAVLRYLRVGWSDYLTLALVIYAVVLFSFIVLTIALQWLAGPRSARKGVMRLALPDASDDLSERLSLMEQQLPAPTPAHSLTGLLAQRGPTQQPLRVTGRLDGGQGMRAGEPLLCERWQQGEGGVARWQVARPFAIAVEGQPAVLVQQASCTAILADYQALDMPSPPPLPIEEALLSWPDVGTPRGPLHQCVLRHGDEVELVAYALATPLLAAESPVTISSSAEGAPYRLESPRMLVAQGDHGHPLLLRKV